jgi:hypothetical protein
MTDPAELAQQVLIAVAAFVKTLPADQLENLVSGTAKLELVPKGGRTTPARASKAAKPLPLPVGEIASMLEQIGNRPAGMQYVNDLKLDAAQLRALATSLGVTVAGKATKQVVTETIVNWVVGRRADSEAIARMSAAR